MNINELNDFRLSDAVKFHGTLNPALFHDTTLRQPMREKMLEIARDFMDHMGLDDLAVKDVQLVGSNAAYSYTPHSDIDLHIVVDLGDKRNDPIYKELFASKKAIYNDKHDIKLRDFDVELYIQDSTESQRTLGAYSVLNNRWIKFPGKTRSNLDELATKQKFMKLVQLSELALRSDDLDKVDSVLDTLKKYRRAGLDVYGEFGPENLAYKALRSHGIIQKLFDHRDNLHALKLSLEENIDDEDDLSPPGAPMADVERIQREIRRRMGADRSKLVWLKPSQLGASYTEQYLNKMGLRKSSVTGNWGGTQNQWDRLFQSTQTKPNVREQELAERYQKEFEDFDPNGPPPGPETKPTMPAGTVRVDVSDVYDWYKLGQNISNLDRVDPKIFGKGPPSTIMAFGNEDEEHKYINALKKTGLTTTDIDPPGGPRIKGQKVDRTYNVDTPVDEDTLEEKWSKKYKQSIDCSNPKGFSQRAHCQARKARQAHRKTKSSSVSETVSDYTTNQDLKDVANWMNTTPDKLKVVVKQEPIGKFIKQIREMYGTYDEFPKDQERTARILKLLKHGAKPLPMYVEANDPDLFVMEGRHRMVAFWLADMKTVPVAYVSTVVEESASGYIPSNAEKNDWRFKSALTVDVHPNSIQQNAEKLGLGKIHRTGVPPIANANGKVKKRQSK